MRRSRFSDEEIQAILAEAQTGESISQICRRHGISEWTFYRWRRKFNQPRERIESIGDIEKENKALKQLVGELTLEMKALQARLRKQ